MGRRRSAGLREADMEIDDPAFNARIKRDAEKRMRTIDSWPPELRECVHEFGYEVVQQFVMNGVTQAKRIRHLINYTLGKFANGERAYYGNHRIKTKVEAAER